ncbi:MAG: nuclear transport factor 2 family protein [Bacteroidota bacterium]
MTRTLCVLVAVGGVVGCTHPSQPVDADADRAEVERILALADRQDEAGLEAYLSYVAPDVVLMPHGQPLVEGRDAYRAHVQAGWTHGQTTVTHEVLALEAYQDVVLARGRAVGTFVPKDSEEAMAFETKNLFVFEREEEGQLRVRQVIFNMNP